jgi:uncharacterized protein
MSDEFAPDSVPRIAQRALLEAMTDTPIVAINGARQVGKSTLARQVLAASGGTMISLDDRAQLDAAMRDPRAFVERDIEGPLIIDEVQFAPPLFRALKAAVDRDRRPGRFVLTGSTRLLSADGFADAFVGRIEIVELWPFSQGEMRGGHDGFIDWAFSDRRIQPRTGSHSRADTFERVIAGGFPEAISRRGRRRDNWFESYVTTLTDRLIRQLSGIERLAEIPRLMALCAARAGDEINVTSIANELGLPPRTVDGYLTLLSNVFVIQLVPAWSTNLSKKVVRRPKLVVVDSGLACSLTGMTLDRINDPTAPLGPLLESFVAMELKKQLGWSETRASLWHFRDRDGSEVDFVLERADGQVVGIEVKASSTITSRDTKGLRFLAARLGDRFHAGFVISTMPEPTPLGDKITAVPCSWLWEAEAG